MEVSSEAVATLIAALIGVLGAVIGSSFGTRKRILDNIKILTSLNSDFSSSKEMLENEINRDIEKSTRKGWKLALCVLGGVLSLGVLIAMYLVPAEFVSMILSDPEKQQLLARAVLACALCFVFTWCVAGVIRWWNK